MTTAWAPIVVLGGAANGVLTQLFPPSCTPGTGATTSGTERRQPQAGVLCRLDIQSDPANDGGTLEIWDLAGTSYPQDPDYGANNIDTTTPPTMTDAYRAAKVALGFGRLLFTKRFSGNPSEDGNDRHWKGHLPFQQGLAARYINGAGGAQVTLSVVADGGFRKIPITG